MSTPLEKDCSSMSDPVLCWLWYSISPNFSKQKWFTEQKNYTTLLRRPIIKGWSLGHSSTKWFHIDKNPPKISSHDVISRIFPSKFQQIPIISVSGLCILLLHIQYLPNYQSIPQFFSIKFSAGFFNLTQLCNSLYWVLQALKTWCLWSMRSNYRLLH